MPLYTTLARQRLQSISNLVYNEVTDNSINNIIYNNVDFNGDGVQKGGIELDVPVPIQPLPFGSTLDEFDVDLISDSPLPDGQTSTPFSILDLSQLTLLNAETGNVATIQQWVQQDIIDKVLSRLNERERRLDYGTEVYRFLTYLTRSERLNEVVRIARSSLTSNRYRIINITARYGLIAGGTVLFNNTLYLRILAGLLFNTDESLLVQFPVVL